jgi:5-methyltetrahydropteroyltriglutamate--homocysteine methyltransferase
MAVDWLVAASHPDGSEPDDQVPVRVVAVARQTLAADELFMTAVSPGCLSTYVPNAHYPDRDAYREALIEALRPEYNTIHGARIVRARA